MSATLTLPYTYDPSGAGVIKIRNASTGLLYDAEDGEFRATPATGYVEADPVSGVAGGYLLTLVQEWTATIQFFHYATPAMDTQPTLIGAGVFVAGIVDTSITVASVTGSVGSVTGSVTVGTNNDKTGYGLATAPLDAAGVRTAVGLDGVNKVAQSLTGAVASGSGNAVATVNVSTEQE